MRYTLIESVSFTDINGNKFPVKPMREYPSYNTLYEQAILAGDYIDEVASRPQVFGTDAEDQSYVLYEANILEIVEARWDLTKLKALKVAFQSNTLG